MHYGELVRRHALRDPTRTAVVDRGRASSYERLHRRSEALAGALTAAGLRPGDRVALLCENRYECVELMVTCASAGFVHVPLDFRLTAREVGQQVSHCGAAAVVVDGDHVDTGRELSGRLDGVRLWVGLDGVDLDGVHHYEDLVGAGRPREPGPAPGDDDVLCILYTSGTTGAAKGVVARHQQALDNAMAVVVEYELDRDSRFLVSYPHSSAGSVHHVFGPTLLLGATIVIDDVRNFDAHRWYATVSDQAVTHSQLVPTMVFRLLSIDVPAGTDLSSLRVIGCSSAPIPTERVHRMIERFGPVLVQAYGMTETMSLATVLSRADHRRPERPELASSCGRPTFGVEVVVEGADGASAPPGTVGEILMRGRWLCREYWADPETTAATFRDGWLRSGDMGWLDEEGYLRLVDRRKDLLIIGGANVSSKAVEDVIYAVPGVLEAAVVGVEDAGWGEVPVVHVVARDGATVTEPDILEHCAAVLPRPHRPVRCHLRRELPKTSTGKIAKNELRRDAARGA